MGVRKKHVSRARGVVPTFPPRGDAVLDAIIISDIHLGSENCQAKALTHFLEEILAGRRPTARLILNGDVFDSIDFRRLKKSHWKVLSLLRKLSDKIDIIWLVGNHDGTAEIVSHLLGVRVEDEYVLTSGGRRLMVLHGHTFDEFIDSHPFLTWVGDVIYALLQKIDPSHAVAKMAKHNSKAFLRNSQKIRAKSVEHARKHGCDAACCGHTHHALAVEDGSVHYYNSGCWTEKPCHYLTVKDGRVEVHAFHEGVAEVEVETTVEAPAVQVPVPVT
jgi:UDP-2,3-diacylglucosamine pyrophosphatase LpxH